MDQEGQADRQKEGRTHRWLPVVRQTAPGKERFRKKAVWWQRCRKKFRPHPLSVCGKCHRSCPLHEAVCHLIALILCSAHALLLIFFFFLDRVLSTKEAALTSKERRTQFIPEPSMSSHSLRTKIHVSPNNTFQRDSSPVNCCHNRSKESRKIPDFQIL